MKNTRALVILLGMCAFTLVMYGFTTVGQQQSNLNRCMSLKEFEHLKAQNETIITLLLEIQKKMGFAQPAPMPIVGTAEQTKPSSVQPSQERKPIRILELTK